MVRPELVVLSILAIAWLIIPVPMTGGTLLGFKEKGDVDDKEMFTATYKFGWPMTWMTFEQSWEKGVKTDSFKLREFDRLNLYLHIMAIAIPVFFFVRFVLREKQAIGVKQT